MTMVSPSLLSADFGDLRRDIEMLNDSACDWFHLDVMDGVFVPNISFGFPVMEAMARHARKPLDVHLMIVQPEKFVKEVKALGAHVMNVHYEACTHLHRIWSCSCRSIRDLADRNSSSMPWKRQPASANSSAVQVPRR